MYILFVLPPFIQKFYFPESKKYILIIDLLIWLGVDTGAVSIISVVKG